LHVSVPFIIIVEDYKITRFRAFFCFYLARCCI